MNFVNNWVNICDSLIKRQFVLSNFISQVNFKPSESWLTQWGSFSELKDTSGNVGAHVIEVGWDGVDSASEVQIVGEIKDSARFERLSDTVSQKKVTSQWMSLIIYLMLPQQLHSILKTRRFEHFRCNLPFIIPLWNPRTIPPYRPHKVYHLQHPPINPPFCLRKYIQHIAYRRYICRFQQILGLLEIRDNFSHFGLFEVICSKVIVFPGSGFVNHG